MSGREFSQMRLKKDQTLSYELEAARSKPGRRSLTGRAAAKKRQYTVKEATPAFEQDARGYFITWHVNGRHETSQVHYKTLEAAQAVAAKLARPKAVPSRKERIAA